VNRFLSFSKERRCIGRSVSILMKSLAAAFVAAAATSSAVAVTSAELLKLNPGEVNQLFTNEKHWAGSDMSGRSAAFAAPLSEPLPPQNCQTMYLGNLGIRCLQYGEAAPVSSPGVDASSLAPVNQYCPEIAIGQLIYGVTPRQGSLACYQFVVQASSTINFELVLPDGLVGVAELFTNIPNGVGFMSARASTSSAVMTGSAVTQYRRMVLVLRLANGVGGKVFGLAINGSVPNPLPATASVSDARTIELNEDVNDVLPAGQSTAYYFVPLRNSQTTALVTAKFTHANLQVAYRSAQRTSPGVYSLGAETIVSAANSSGQQITFSSAYPANSAGSPNIAGTMVRVTSLTGAATNEPFEFRVGARAVGFVGFDILNTENISRWYPVNPAQLQAANYIITKVGAKDQNGAWVKNHPVELTVDRNVAVSTARQITRYLTNVDGQMSLNGDQATSGSGYSLMTTFPGACTGTVIAKNNYGPPGTPRDHWNGTAQNGRVTIKLLGAVPISPASATGSLIFTRICSETYLGYY
jgi:hypothetical protein